MSRPWDPFGGGSQKPWNGDAFGGGRSPYGAARPTQDPWAAAPDPWGAAPQPYQVPAAASAAPAPARGDTGRYRVLSGLRRPTAAPVYSAGYQQGYPQASGYSAPFSGYAAPAAPVTPAAPPRAVPQTRWGVYQAVDPFGSPLSPAAAAPAAPPKTRPVTPIVLGAAAIVVALIVVAGAVVVVAKKGTTSTASGPITTASASATVTTPVTTTSYPTSTTRRTTSTSTTKTTPTGTAALQDNPLFANFGAGLQRQVCNPVGWPSDAAAGKAFFDSLAPCLDTAWKPLVASTGLAYRAPAVLVPTGTVISSPCGTEDLNSNNVAAFYCGSNQTLYMPIPGLQPGRYGDQPIIYISVFAHEFGHHIQNVTGILAAELDLEHNAGPRSDAGLEASRRTELEAQCFSGMFVGSITDTGGMFTQADYQTNYDDQRRGDRAGEPRDHGTSAHEQGWWKLGGDTDQIGQCNTWLAPASDVE
ncbi:neutral zinc metallopeptidase [Mycobacterium sp. pUA109]|uniref:neutral zinc metallopeptidase n=1 Tax=Mycobacterium sp. pUA109 TaxID=3238982 RepID=UPI00351B9188